MRIYVYMYIRNVMFVQIRRLRLFTLSYLYIFVSDFDLTSLPCEVNLDFYFAKVSQPGNTESTGTSPIGGKISMILRNRRLRFPINLSADCLPNVPLWAVIYHAHKRFEMTVTPE